MAIQEIRVAPKNKQGLTVVYCFEDIRPDEAELLRVKVLTDPVTQQSTLNISQEGVRRIGYRPGVTDPLENTLLEVAKQKGIQPRAVATYREYPPGLTIPFISQVEEEVVQIPETLIFECVTPPTEHIKISELNEKQLTELSKTRSLFLNTEEMKVIQHYYASVGREPTDIELETLAQTWSEHNGHKTFKAKLIDSTTGQEKSPLITRIKQTAEQFFERVDVVTAFKDNAGGVAIDDIWAIIGKWETHNKPVGVEPFGGAQTKFGGAYRDPASTGKGAINLVGVASNNFAYPDTLPQDVPPGCLHPRLLLKENSRGERTYGNPMGIPTHRVDLHFHPDFIGTPTSMGGVIALIPKDLCEKEDPKPGDLIITVGGKTGRDGIHGATFSSGAMTDETKTTHATAVQLGNPIEEKREFDALIACRDANLIRVITDCGGGGYSSAIGEMGEHVGAEVELGNVRLKYKGLAPWEIWLSEAQEREIIAVDPVNLDAVKKICDLYEVPIDVIGTFTGDKELRLKYNGKIVGQLSMEFLHNGLPQRTMHMKYKPITQNHEVPNTPTDINDAWKKILSDLNVASTAPMLNQYDKTVQARNALDPFTGIDLSSPSDASVIMPIYGKPLGVVTAQGSNPILNRLDPYWGSVWAATKAMSNFVAVGGNPDKAALIDNFVWPFPDSESLGDLDRSVTALCDMMNVLQLPCVSGKDSLSSTYTDSQTGRTIKIPPVLNVSVFGGIPDVAKTVSCDIKLKSIPADHTTLVLVGTVDQNRLGGSVYFQTQGIQNTDLPKVDIDQLPKTLHAIHNAINFGGVLSCHDVSEGGIATTIAQMCFGGDCGAIVNIKDIGATRSDFALFNETAGVFVIEVADKEKAEQLFANVPHVILGNTTYEKHIAVYDGETLLTTTSVDELKDAWQRPMKELYP